MLALKRANTLNDTEGTEKDKENADNPPKRRSIRLTRNTRSMAEDGGEMFSLPEEEVKKPLPYVEYRGMIKYLTDGYEIAESSDSIMQWVEKQPGDDLVPISFDMEWPFSFKTGPGKSAVIQMCAEEDICYVFQLSNLKNYLQPWWLCSSTRECVYMALMLKSGKVF
ncbi:hypothetical protein DOY81_011854 [Sarcophaga bullata]|nr:hypothetical protein DOY81_011854 [Sarcophaga bullata]